MNKYIYAIIIVITTLAFAGLLVSIILTDGGHLELILCALAAFGSCILFFHKKERLHGDKKESH